MDVELKKTIDNLKMLPGRRWISEDGGELLGLSPDDQFVWVTSRKKDFKDKTPDELDAIVLDAVETLERGQYVTVSSVR